MQIIFLLLPGLLCLIVALTIWSRQNLTLSLRLLGWTMLVASFYLTFAGLTCFRHTNPYIMVWSFIGLGFTVPTLQFFVMLLCWSLHTQRQRYNKYALLLLILPALTGFFVMAGYGLIGFDAAADYLEHNSTMPAGLSHIEKAEYDVFRFLSADFYEAVSWLCVLSSFAYLFFLLYRSDFTPMVLLRFLFRRGPLRPMHAFIVLYFCIVVCSTLRLHVDRQYTLDHETLYCILFIVQAPLIVLVGMVSYRFKSPCLYLRRPHRQPTYDDLPVRVHNLHGMRPADADELEDEEAESYRTLNLRDELKVLMREELCYLQPGMSRYSVSRRLELSRTGLDRLIFLLHHVSYDEYVMVQRVEYLRRYRLQYPDEPAESVAMACGFPNVQIMKRELKECSSLFEPIDEAVLS